MRGDDQQSGHLCSYPSPEQRVPADHPLRTIRQMTDEACGSCRPVRGDLRHDGSAIGAARASWQFFAAVLIQARRRRLVSDEHFTVDGTLLEAWAAKRVFRVRTARARVRRTTTRAIPP